MPSRLLYANSRSSTIGDRSTSVSTIAGFKISGSRQRGSLISIGNIDQSLGTCPSTRLAYRVATVAEAADRAGTTAGHGEDEREFPANSNKSWDPSHQ